MWVTAYGWTEAEDDQQFINEWAFDIAYNLIFIDSGWRSGVNL